MRFVLVLAALAAISFPSAAAAADRVDPYPLDTCPVSGEKLGGMGDPIVIQHEGREFRFCCEKCVKKFKSDSAKFIAQVDEKIIAQQKASYPLDTCVVSGEELDEDAITVVVNNRLIRTCCKKCARKVKSSPEKFLAKIDQAIIAQQSKKYPLQTCPISGEELGGMGKPVDMVIGNRLVRLCCKSCKKKVLKDPAKVLAQVEAAWKKSGDGKAGKSAPTTRPRRGGGSQ